MTDEKKPWPKTHAELLTAGYTVINYATCKGPTCNTTVYFYKTPKGNKMPLSVVNPNPDADNSQWEYQPHWADCPDEKRFRR